MEYMVKKNDGTVVAEKVPHKEVVRTLQMLGVVTNKRLDSAISILAGLKIGESKKFKSYIVSRTD